MTTSEKCSRNTSKKLYKQKFNKSGDDCSHDSELNMTNIKYPVMLSDIDKFERQNISVNLFGVEGKTIISPLRIA